MNPSIKESLEMYVSDHRPVGGFLTAVLENRLFEAFRRADSENEKALKEIICFVWNELPLACWGSPEKVAAWLEKKG